MTDTRDQVIEYLLKRIAQLENNPVPMIRSSIPLSSVEVSVDTESYQTVMKGYSKRPNKHSEDIIYSFDVEQYIQRFKSPDSDLITFPLGSKYFKKQSTGGRILLLILEKGHRLKFGRGSICLTDCFNSISQYNNRTLYSMVWNNEYIEATLLKQICNWYQIPYSEDLHTWVNKGDVNHDIP